MVEKSDPSSLILTFLKSKKRPLAISAIARMTGLERHTVAHHLDILRLNGRVDCLHHGRAKKYFLVNHHEFYTSTTPDLIALLDSNLNVLYFNEGQIYTPWTQSNDTKPDRIDSLSHPAVSHPDLFKFFQEAHSHKMFHGTLVCPREKGGRSYHVTIAPVTIPRKGPGFLLFIEESLPNGEFHSPIAREVAVDLGTGIVVIDPAGLLIYANRAVRNSLGLDDTFTVMGKNVTDLFDIDPDLLRTLVHKKGDNPAFYETRGIKKDGEEVDLLIHWDIIRSADNRPIYLTGLILDLSVREILRERIWTFNTRFRQLVENTPDVVWESGPDLRYTYVSPAITRTTGYLPEEFIGRDLYWLDEPSLREKTWEFFLNAAGHGSGPLIREHTIRHRNGEPLIIETHAAAIFSPSGKFMGFSGIDRNITATKMAQMDLRRNEEKMRAIFNSTFQFTGMMTPEGILLEANQAALDFINAKPEDVVNKPFWKTPWWQGNKERVQQLKAAIQKAAGGSFVRYEVDLQGTGSSTMHADFSIKPILNPDGTVRLLIPEARDITKRKAAEEALRTSEEKYRSIVENTNDAVYIHDFKGTILDVNENACRMTGYTREELVGASLAKIDRGWRSSENQDLDRLLVAGRGVFERENIGKDGFVFSIEVSVVILSREGDGICQAFVRDITERKNIEHALKVSEGKFRNLVEINRDIIYSAALDGTLLYISPQVTSQLGYIPDELTGTNFKEYIHPDDGEPLFRHIQEIRAGEKRSSPDRFRVRGKDGQYRWFEDKTAYTMDQSGRTIMTGTICDITEQKRAEQLIRQSSERFQSLFNHSLDGVYIHDLQGNFLDVNPAALMMLGYTRDEIANVNIQALLNKDQLEKARSAIAEIVRSGSQVEGTEYTFADKEGREIIVETMGTLIKEDGNPSAIIGIARDITGRKQAEESLKESFYMFKIVMDSLDAVVYVADIHTHEILFVNEYGRKIFGDVTGTTCWKSLQAGQEGPCPFCTNPQLLEPGWDPGDVITRELKNTITGQWFECRDSAIRWIDGRVVRLEIATNITERKQAEETIKSALTEKDLQLREIHHRLRNNLASIISLIDLERANNSGSDQFARKLQDIEARIRSIALMHESLLQTERLTDIPLKIYVNNLITHLTRSYGVPADIRWNIDLEELSLPPVTAIPCGLILTEIITNSLKHAFREDAPGLSTRGEPCKISISAREEAGFVVLNVSDNGKGMPKNVDFESQRSLGLTIIRLLTRNQLCGSLAVNTSGSVSYTIRFLKNPERKEETMYA